MHDPSGHRVLYKWMLPQRVLLRNTAPLSAAAQTYSKVAATAADIQEVYVCVLAGKSRSSMHNSTQDCTSTSCCNRTTSRTTPAGTSPCRCAVLPQC
jgi:hypothetical protein